MEITEDIIIDDSIDFKENPFYEAKNDLDDKVENAGPGNPYRDKEGKFASGPGGASIASTNEAADALTEGNRKLATANSGSAVSKQVENQRAAVEKFLTENGGDIEKFKSIDENWVGNDYKELEGYAKDGSSKEVLLMHDLQQTYFKKNGIEDVTVYRGVYGEQAKAIKAAIKNGKSVEIGADYASSWTGYQAVAADYADGAAFTAPDKITDSVVIKQTFKAKDILYSTQVAAFYAGNADDEFIVSSPKGFTVDPSNIEVIK